MLQKRIPRRPPRGRRGISYKLQATSYKLQATSYKLQATSYKLQATSYKLQATSYKLQATSYKLFYGFTQYAGSSQVVAPPASPAQVPSTSPAGTAEAPCSITPLIT